MNALILSIALFGQSAGDRPSFWVTAEYTGPATTWTVRLIPQSCIGGPVWFGDGDTVTVSGWRTYSWLVSSYDQSAIFSAELIGGGQ